MSKKVLLATGGYDHTVRFWEAASGICYRTLQFTESHVNRLTFSPDKLNLAVAGNPRIVVFDAVSNLPNPVLAFEGHRGNVVAVGYEAYGGWLYSGSDDGSLRTWDPRSGKQAHSFRNRSPITDVALHPAQREIVSCDQAGNIRVWDLVANRLNRELTPHDDVPICSMSVSPDGKLLAACNYRGHCFVWNLDKRREQRAEAAPVGTQSGEYGAEPRRSEGDGGEAERGMDEEGGSDEREIAEEPALTSAQAQSRDDGGDAVPLRFQPLTTWQPHSRYVLRTVFSPNGSTLATALDSGCVRLWNVSLESGEPWQQQRILGRHQKWVWDAVFSENSEFLFTASSDKKACLWDLSSGSVIRTYEGHKNPLTSLAISVTTEG